MMGFALVLFGLGCGQMVLFFGDLFPGLPMWAATGLPPITIGLAFCFMVLKSL
jgi:hypothetical protein